MMLPWWERYPGRLEFEKAELEKLGASFKVDQELFERGTVVMRGDFRIEGQKINLEIIFPESYPYFRFKAYAFGLDYQYHQHPFEKHLCLLGQSSQEWYVTDTVASVLQEQLRKIMVANKARTKEELLELEGGTIGKIEVRQAEPIEMYHQYEPFGIMLIDGSWQITQDHGSLLIGFKLDSHLHRLDGAVLEVRDHKNQTIHKADPAISQLYNHHVKGRWQHVPRLIKKGTASEYLKELVEYNNGFKVPILQNVKNLSPITGKADVQMDFIAAVYEDEAGWREQKRNHGWMFVVRRFLTVQDRKPGKKVENKQETKTFFLKIGRSGYYDMTIRIPELTALATKKIAIFGLGCLGSQSALEFAKAGIGELRLLDCDIVEPGNAARWILGISAAGMPKVLAVQNYIMQNYPYTKVVPIHYRLGSAMHPEEKKANTPSEKQILDKMLNDVDLVYDATAEVGVQYFLSELARERKIPYICISTTHGTRGGRIARFIPGSTEGCYICLRNHLEDGSTILPPNRDESDSSTVQPAGCGSQTFTGNNFDASEVTFGGVRMAVSTLMTGELNGYPQMAWDVAIVNLRDSGGKAIPPEWKVYKLKRHLSCNGSH